MESPNLGRSPSQPQDRSHRHSLPQPATIPSRRSSNRVKLQPASPEVISSLISTLSAISSPTESQFDGPSSVRSAHTVPSSPTFHSRDAASVTGSGFGMDYGAYNQSEKEDGRLHPDDAAIPPVVRTAPRSRPTSGIFSGTKRRSLSISVRGQPDEQNKLPDEPGTPRSIGNLSIEPGLWKSSASIRSFGSTRSELRGQRSLDFKSSKGKMREMDRERERKRKSTKVEEGETASTPPLPTVPTNSSHASNTAGSESIKPGSPKSPTQAPSFQEPAVGPSSRMDMGESTESHAGKITIPNRDSSKRHSLGSTTARRKRKSHRSDHANVSEEQDDEIAEPLPPLPAEKISDDPEEDEVSKRIRELKAQKELRDRQKKAEDEPEPEPGDSSRQIHSGRSSLPATLHARSEHEEPNTSAAVRSTQPKRRKENLAVPRARSPMKPLAVNGTQRSVSADGRSTKASEVFPGKYRAFESQYNAQKKSVIPLGIVSPSEGQNQTFFNSPAQATRQTLPDGRPSTADSIDDEVEAYLSAARLSQKIHHPQTGRIISFSDVGDPNGYVVFCCVGMGLTRYLTAFYDDLALTLKLRLITIDRPGVGESEAYTDGTDTPLGWPDDVRAVCQHLSISRFSILAHSAGAIYALATALRMPQHIRGRIHLLAPWIPPSQLSAIGTHQEPLPVTAIPYSQRLLRSLPTPFLKAANSNFFSATSNSITTSLPKSPRRAKRKSLTQDAIAGLGDIPAPSNRRSRSTSRPLGTTAAANAAASHSLAADVPGGTLPSSLRASHTSLPNPSSPVDKERQAEYDTRLTHAIWDLSTANANPAVDLLVCLERRQDIGFRYVDITKAVVIHHGSRDSRVPVENVKWLGKTMRRCEVRVLEGEGHGLMASAVVMGGVLEEISREWEDWEAVVRGKRGEKEKGEGKR